jgi:hypothetical protein
MIGGLEVKKAKEEGEHATFLLSIRDVSEEA